MIKQLKIIIATSCLCLTAFSSNAQNNYELSELINMKFDEQTMGTEAKNKENAFRSKAMKEAAMAVGAQNGYVKHLNYLKKEILDEQEHFDDLFDFSLIMKLASSDFEEMHLLPPAIRKTENIIRVSADASRIEISGELYEIIKPARLVSIAPNWRQYLIYDQKISINKPADILLPRNKSEEENWALWVQEGWTAGIAQAEREMTFRSRKLGQDFNGMIEYIKELTAGNVLKPLVSSSKQDVVGGGNRMIKDHKIIQLAMPAKLDPDSSNWEPLLLDTRGSLRQPIESERYQSIFNVSDND